MLRVSDICPHGNDTRMAPCWECVKALTPPVHKHEFSVVVEWYEPTGGYAPLRGRLFRARRRACLTCPEEMFVEDPS